MKTFTVTNSQYVNKKDDLQLFNTGVGKWFDIKILDAGINWHMWYKPLVLLTHVANLPDDELVLYCDAMDVTINAYPTKSYKNTRPTLKEKWYLTLKPTQQTGQICPNWFTNLIPWETLKESI